MHTLLNEYTYEEKPLFHHLLDRGSAPVRLALGGRKVSLVKDTEGWEPEARYRPVFRISLLALSILCFPVFLISLSCLAIKKFKQKEFDTKIKAVLPTHSPVTDPKTTRKLIQGYEYLELHKPKEDEPQVYISKLPGINLSGLTVCSCSKAPKSLRKEFIRLTVDELEKIYAKESKITVLSMGAAGGYDELAMLCALYDKGYRTFSLVLVDLKECPVHRLKMLSSLIISEATIEISAYVAIEDYKGSPANILMMIDLDDYSIEDSPYMPDAPLVYHTYRSLYDKNKLDERALVCCTSVNRSMLGIFQPPSNPIAYKQYMSMRAQVIISIFSNHKRAIERFRRVQTAAEFELRTIEKKVTVICKTERDMSSGEVRVVEKEEIVDKAA